MLHSQASNQHRHKFENADNYKGGQKGIEKDQPNIEVNGEPLREIVNERIDEEGEQSFPASDPPSYSKPGNDDIKPGEEDVKKGKK